jgi:hypothetical protein
MYHKLIIKIVFSQYLHSNKMVFVQHTKSTNNAEGVLKFAHVRTNQRSLLLGLTIKKVHLFDN